MIFRALVLLFTLSKSNRRPADLSVCFGSPFPPAPSHQERASLPEKVSMACAALLLFCLGCKADESPNPIGTVASKSVRTPHVAPGTDPWTFTWTDESNWTPPLLWNGLIGVRIGKNGLATDENGDPMSMYLIDDYDLSGSESIRKIDNPIRFALDGSQPLTPKSGWKQSLNLSMGIVDTSYDLASGQHIDTEVVVDPKLPQVSYRVRITGYGTITGTPTTVSGKAIGADRISLWKTDKSVPMTPIINGRPPKLLAGSLNKSGIDALLRIESTESAFYSIDPSSPPAQTTEQTIAFSSTVAKAEHGSPVKGAKGYLYPPASFDPVASRSSVAWADRWKTDIEIDGPIEDQQAIRSFLFYLRSAISPQGKMSISPMGLSNDIYSGHVFWDADMWVFPALALVDPERAKAIPEYRSERWPAAIQNYGLWIQAGKPTATRNYKPKGIPTLSGGVWIGAKYPWESSVSGKETATGSSRFEDHITGSVAFSMSIADSLGLTTPESARMVAGSALPFYNDRSEYLGDGKIALKSVMSPDENHIGDNDLYTNLLAQWCLNRGLWNPPQDFSPPKYILPQDKTSFLTYDNDPLKGYKQAAAVLSIYPLQYQPAEAQAKVMMDRFADKVIKNGPAMTDSVHAIIWARLGDTDKAYATWRAGWMDFVRPPFFLFSEKRNQDRVYFTTGAAGELQSVIYGFLGFRIDSKPEAGASWSLKLKGERWLSIKPNLPKEWKRVTFRNFHVLGKTYTLTATHQSVQVTQGD